MTRTVKPTESDLASVAMLTGLDPEEVLVLIACFRATGANPGPMKQEDMLLRAARGSALIHDVGTCAASLVEKILLLIPAQRAKLSALFQSLTCVREP